MPIQRQLHRCLFKIQSWSFKINLIAKNLSWKRVTSIKTFLSCYLIFARVVCSYQSFLFFSSIFWWNQIPLNYFEINNEHFNLSQAILIAAPSADQKLPLCCDSDNRSEKQLIIQIIWNDILYDARGPVMWLHHRKFMSPFEMLDNSHNGIVSEIK